MRFVPALLLTLPLAFTACKKKAPADEDVALAASDASKSGSVSPETLAELAANFSKVFFEVDSADLNATTKEMLSANAKILAAHPVVLVEIEGHADERGTTDYNLALGEKRASAVRTYLLAQGVTSGAVKTVSYGEERPAADGSNESVWAQNRRAEFRILVGAGH